MNLVSKTTLTLTGHIKVPLTDLDAVRAGLPAHIALTRAEPGCLNFDVEVDAYAPAIFHVNEEFADSVSYIHHQERVRDSSWGAITKNVERHYEIKGMPA